MERSEADMISSEEDQAQQTSPERAASQEPEHTYTVKLVRTEASESLGIDLVRNAARIRLFVVSVKDSGLVAEWNRDNPGRALRFGHEIISVNGERSSADAMFAEVTRADNL